MPNRFIARRSMTAKALVASLLTAAAVSAAAADLTIWDSVVAPGVPAAQRNADLEAARAFYGFWNTGDQALLDRAVAPSFTDHTLPPGRPQGPSGPAFASKALRTAVPDLGVTVEKLVIAGDMMTVHMVFSGHFTGAFGKVKGAGQPIRFIATDLLKITDGKITDNWHIEDNLTLYELAGDEAWSLPDLAAEIGRQTGQAIAYQDMPEEAHAGVLQQAGLPEPLARLFADSDAGAADGALFDDSRTLSRLIGRPTTPIARSVADALAKQG